MDALVMCGGRGRRLEADVEKPLFEVRGRAMVEHVLEALAASRVGEIHAVTSPQAPRTRAFLSGETRPEWTVKTVDAPGDGYVPDLQFALDGVGRPVLTVGADLPLLDGQAVDGVLERAGEASLSVGVPVGTKRDLGVSVDTATEVDGRRVSPAGVNVVAAGDTQEWFVTGDPRYAVNVNTLEDARVARRLLGDGESE